MIVRFILFLMINCGALLVGGFFTNAGVNSEWYQGLNKAPWTPPGAFFGIAWFTIMILLAIYMTYALKEVKNKNRLIIFFVIQIILNIIWNPLFFYNQNVLLGFITISLLTVLMGVWFLSFTKEMGSKTLLLLPYFLWLIVATSLNLYILIKN